MALLLFSQVTFVSTTSYINGQSMTGHSMLHQLIGTGVCLEKQTATFLDGCTDLCLTDLAWHSLVVPWVSVAWTTEISWTSGSCCQALINFFFIVSDWSDDTRLAQDSTAWLCQFLLNDQPAFRLLFPSCSHIPTCSDLQSGKHLSVSFMLSLHDQIIQLQILFQVDCEWLMIGVREAFLTNLDFMFSGSWKDTSATACCDLTPP